MNNLTIINPTKPTLTRIINSFESTNIANNKQEISIIKDYLYVDQKRIIA